MQFRERFFRNSNGLVSEPLANAFLDSIIADLGAFAEA